tara:strand:+ start:583 stop:798 length:216 start_codon:yes stop_codon:yes gene_type:complete
MKLKPDNNDIINNFLNIGDIKKELKNIIKSILNIVMDEIKPYMFLTVIFICTIFLLILAIFILQIRFLIAR